jgi:PhnB protein
VSIHEVFAYLCVSDAARALAFYAQAFGAVEKLRLTEPGGRIGHAELDFDGTTIMLSDEFPEVGVAAPDALRPASVTIHLHVDDADAVIARAVEAGATLTVAPRDQFYGERSGVVRDPFGHRWLIGHHIEDVSGAEMQRRYAIGPRSTAAPRP